MKKPLFRWPLRRSQGKVVTYSFRLAIIAGEATTPIDRRTYPFDLVFDKTMPRDRIEKAVMLRAVDIAEDMAKVIITEVMAAADATTKENG